MRLVLSLTRGGAAACGACLCGSYLLFCEAVACGLESSVPLCPFRLVTGLGCPLCGLSRSIAAASSGNLQRALDYHILGPVMLPALIVIGVALAAVALRRREPLLAAPLRLDRR